MLGVPVRRVEAAAWLGSGLVCGAAGLLLSNLVGLDIAGLTFLVIPALAAALIGQLRSLWVTLAAGIVIGVVVVAPDTRSPSLADYRTMTPFVLAIIALLWFAAAAAALTRDGVMGAVRTAGEPARRARVARARVRETLASPLRLLVLGGLLAFVLLALPALLDTLLAADHDLGRDLQHRHARARASDRTGRHGLALPVRPARGGRVGGASARLCDVHSLPVAAPGRRAGHGGDRHAHRVAGAAAHRASTWR